MPPGIIPAMAPRPAPTDPSAKVPQGPAAKAARAFAPEPAIGRLGSPVLVTGIGKVVEDGARHDRHHRPLGPHRQADARRRQFDPAPRPLRQDQRPIPPTA
jgi:hypothetical protein